MNKIAKFEKVSISQFRETVLKLFGNAFSEKMIEDIYSSISLPVRSTTGSAGYDIKSPIGIAVEAGNSVVIPTGIRCSMEDGWVLNIYPRSGLGFKYHMALANTVGIIDSDYYYSDNEGHIMVKIVNNNPKKEALCISEGDRFCQGVFTPFGITVDDNATGKRNGGFNSTGR